MKIICPEHKGLIEIPEKEMMNALNTPSKVLVFICPVCEDEVMIQNIQLENIL